MWKGNLSLPCIQPRLYDSMPYNTQKPNLALALWKVVYLYIHNNVYTGLKYPPQLDSPFLPEAMVFVFVLKTPPVNKDLQSIPSN